MNTIINWDKETYKYLSKKLINNQKYNKIKIKKKDENNEK